MATTRLTAVNQRTTAACRRCASLHGARAAPAGSSSALSGAVRATRGAARAARHSPRQAVQCQSRLANTARSTSMLLAMQHNAAPACSRRCGAAAPPPRLVHGEARGGTALHQLQEVRASQWKHKMLSHHPQLCAAQGTGYAAQSRLPGCPRGCLWTAWKRVLASSAAMPSARASEQRENGEGAHPRGGKKSQ